jgi:DNA polymerase-3 subunit beta
MILEIARDTLLDSLSKTVPITEKRTSLPILSHVLLEAASSTVTLIATDLEVGIRVINESQVSEPGLLAIPSKKMYEIVRELSTSTVKLRSLENNRMVIEAGLGVFELSGMDAGEYPAWVMLDQAQTVTVSAEKLLHMIDKTMFAASTDDSRFNLNGILFEQDGQQTRFVATDGHRLALVNEELGFALESSVVVPRKGIGELRRVLEGVKEEITFGIEQKNLFVKTERFMMTVRLIEGDYPDYRKVIPERGNKIVKINRQELIRTVRRVAVLTSDRNKGITIQVVPGNMEVTAVHPDLGTAKDALNVQYEGEEFSIIVNASYLQEAVAAIDTDLVSLEFHKEGSPIILRPEEVDTYFNLVMPMRK